MSTRPRDKHGTEISAGDTVELVYGGDRHQMVVESIGESHGIPTVTGAVTITHHAPAVKVTARSKKASKRVPAPGGEAVAAAPRNPPTIKPEDSNG